MNTQAISTKYFELVIKFAAVYEENYGKWGGLESRAVQIYRRAFEERNELQALLAQGKAVLV